MALTFLHPHIETTVIDNSFVVETADGGGTALFMPYLSEKGVDNKLELFTSLGSFLDAKGLPNFKKHGQAIYNVIRWIQGGGRVYGMRLMPEDATLANTILNIKTKATDVPVYKKKADGSYEKDASGNRIQESNGGTPVTRPGVDIKVDTISLPNLLDKASIKILMEALPATDEDGYSNHPIMALNVKGRGAYGNNFTYRLALNTNLEDTYDFRVYDFTVLERTSNGNLRVVDGPYQVSLFPEALSLAGTSMFITQVIKNFSKNVEAVFSDKAYDALVDHIMEATKDAEGEYTISSPQAVDVLFGFDKKGQLDEFLKISEGAAVDGYEGISFTGGSDGAFDIKNTASARTSAIETALVSAYTGITDPTVLNKKQYPIDIALDANFPINVKRALAQFCAERRDVFGVTDTGVLPSPSAAVAWRTNQFQEDSYYVGIFGQSYTVSDPYTSMDIPVTATYMLANKIPSNDAQYGIQFPFVGPNRGTVDSFTSVDWNPDEYQKEDLYKARINYAEQDYRSTKFMSQLTTQFRTSALSNINNVRVLMKMIRSVEELSENYYFEFPDQNTLNGFNTELANIMSEWTNNGACSSATASAYQDAYDAEQKIARVRIEVVFNNVIERILIEFNVGK